MKNIITLVLLTSSLCFGQNNQPAMNDFERINISILNCQNVEGMSDIANNMISDKLKSMLLKNSIGSSFGSRFILVPNVVLETKDILSTAPVKHVYVIRMYMFIGDGVTGTLYSSESIKLKGVGDSETKAYIDAFSHFNPNEKKFQEFISEGKNRIIQYYNAQCDVLISEARTYANENKFDQALFHLSSIPSVCLTCFNKVQPVINEIYLKKINTECKSSLMNARTVWMSSQEESNADYAGQILQNINPNSDCYDEAVKLSTEISNRLMELNNRQWSYQLKIQQDEVDLNKEIIRAARDIGVAYGQNQPKNITYNYVLWW